MRKISAMMLLLSACSEYKAPDLPDLARESFSSEEILQRQKDLEEKTKEIESNIDCRKAIIRYYSASRKFRIQN